MNDDRRSILQLLSEGKINADAAERLLSALDRAGPEAAQRGGAASSKTAPRYLRVLVDTDEPHGSGTKVNVRVPMSLLRAGVRLTSIIPPVAREHIHVALREQGVPLDLEQLKPENLEDLIEQLNELTVDVDQENTKVRVYCE